MLKLGDNIKFSQKGIVELSKQSLDHLNEFKDSIGVVKHIYEEYNEIKVRWLCGLNYIYPEDYLYDYTLRTKKFKRLLKEK